jgi:lantibiotic modifying enzyme
MFKTPGFENSQNMKSKTMLSSNRKHNNELLQRVINHLIINSSFLDNLGLFRGKMGIVIFFFHYSRHTSDSLYKEFAENLLNEIFEEIHNRLPVDLEDGYLGIGWAIEYLAQQGFIEGDTNEILEDIDRKVMERDIRRISDMSLNIGLEGVFHYVLSRLHNNQDVNNIFDEQYFFDLYNAANKIDEHDISKSLFVLIDNYKQWHQAKKLKYNPSTFLKSFCLAEISENNNVWEWELGLNGCAGIGLKGMIE